MTIISQILLGIIIALISAAGVLLWVVDSENSDKEFTYDC